MSFGTHPSAVFGSHFDSHALDTPLWPKLAKFAPGYPGIQVKVIIDSGLTDVVAERSDAGCALASWWTRT